MKFEDLEVGRCYSFSKNSVRVYINIISNNSKQRKIRYNMVTNGGLSLEFRGTYEKDERTVSCRKITMRFFKDRLAKSKDFTTGVRYGQAKEHTLVREVEQK
jgi:hypothetical protein